MLNLPAYTLGEYSVVQMQLNSALQLFFLSVGSLPSLPAEDAHFTASSLHPLKQKTGSEIR